MNHVILFFSLQFNSELFKVLLMFLELCKMYLILCTRYKNLKNESHLLILHFLVRKILRILLLVTKRYRDGQYRIYTKSEEIKS